ncbi:MAG: hypothetical protein O7D91_19510, partial [Planctomycetota bacterium]|nr:hypothetical protein [Planctomycetota bacterium]
MASASRLKRLSYAAPSSVVLSYVAVGIALMGAPGNARADTVVPTDGMVITEDTTFEPGTYNLPNGVSIGASRVTLDMNGAVLVGTNFANYGVTSIGHSAVTIINGVVENYYYGMRLENGTAIQILDNPTYSSLAATLPPLLLSRFMCWSVIAQEFTLVVLLAIPRFRPAGIVLGIIFQLGLFFFTGNSFGQFFYVVTFSYLAFVEWP